MKTLPDGIPSRRFWWYVLDLPRPTNAPHAHKQLQTPLQLLPASTHALPLLLLALPGAPNPPEIPFGVGQDDEIHTVNDPAYS
jgi:hypothetical protein